jgi:ankyrin repeat protein
MNNIHDLQNAIVRDINSLHQAGGLFQTLFRLQGVTLNQNNYNQIIRGFSSTQSLPKDRIEALTSIIFHYLNIRVEPDMAVFTTEQQKASAPAAATKPSTNLAAPATRQETLPKIEINKNSYKAMQDAITKGDLHTVKVHLHSGAKIDHVFRGGFTPLLLAAKHQQWSLVDFLVTQGADINAVNSDNFTLLSAVISEKKQDLFERLTSKNIHQNVLDMGISSCVLDCADRYYIDRLKAKGARLTQRLADFLLGRNEPRFVEYIFQHDLLDRHSLNQSLIEACGSYRRDLSIIKRFVSQGADIRCKAKNDRNLIIATVYTSGYDVFEYDDETLETELDDQEIAVIHYLTEQGVEINEPDVVGRTALHYAVAMNHLSMVSFLLRKGADLHIRDLLGKTALDYADEKGYDEIANLLAGNAGNGRATSSQSSPSDQSSTAQPIEAPSRRKLKLNFEE